MAFTFINFHPFSLHQHFKPFSGSAITTAFLGSCKTNCNCGKPSTVRWTQLCHENSRGWKSVVLPPRTSIATNFLRVYISPFRVPKSPRYLSLVLIFLLVSISTDSTSYGPCCAFSFPSPLNRSLLINIRELIWTLSNFIHSKIMWIAWAVSLFRCLASTLPKVNGKYVIEFGKILTPSFGCAFLSATEAFVLALPPCRSVLLAKG